MPHSFYIHIPYCVKRRGYCDFNTYTPGELKEGSDIAQVSNDYIDLLIQEAKIARAELKANEPIPSIFFGGGTPTLMARAVRKRSLSFIHTRKSSSHSIEVDVGC
jgi:oxygen-independent coproporphyrinogen-3 oxidase